MEIFTFSSACFHLEALKTCHKENSISEAKVLLVVPEMSNEKEILSLSL